MRAAGFMRVAITTDAVGGVWRYSVDGAGELSRRGVEVTLAGFGPQPSMAQRAEAEAAGALVVWLDERLDWTVADEDAARDLADGLDGWLADARPDVVHLNSPALAPFLAAPVSRVVAAHSCLATWWRAVRGDEPPASWRWHHELTRKGLAGADMALAPSEAFAQLLREVYGPLPALRVVHNATRPVAAGPKREFVLSAGRWWDDAKNLDALAAAAPDIAWPVRIAGPLRGPEGNEREPAAVDWLGDLPNGELRRRMAGAPIFTSLSLYEPFGLSVLEAASAGAALVLSDIPTFRELWGSCALFVDPLDPGAVAWAVNRVIEDSTFRARLAEAAAMQSRSFTLQRQAEGLQAAYLTATSDEAMAV